MLRVLYCYVIALTNYAKTQFCGVLVYQINQSKPNHILDKSMKLTRSILSPTLLLMALFAVTLSVLSGCSNKESITAWPLVDNCNLHEQACESQQGDAKVRLQINPHPIPIAKPLGIQVNLENLAASRVQLDISGVNMYMGYNRVTLAEKGQGYYVGTSMLAFCTSQKMDWQITLMIYLEDGTQVQVPYSLQTITR